MPLLTSKLHVPAPRPGLVRRPQLIERLAAGLHHNLVLISAPAGFGKTTLLSAWIAASEWPAAWLSLDERDRDPYQFMAYFIAALQTIDPGIGQVVANVLEASQPPPLTSILTALLNDIAAVSGAFLLVLDDYHLLEAPEVDEALTFLIEYLPAQMHLVIATREDPQFPLARLRVRHQLMELRVTDLRFTVEEAADFLNHSMGLTLSAQDVLALERRTEGWVAGLQLAALSLQGRTDAADFVQAFTGSHRFIVDYLIEEVLHRQPEPIRQFLLQTSILDRLSGDLCAAVTNAAGSQKLLETLERGNLFVVALDDQRHWYRYHHLFADALRNHLHSEQAEAVPNLHQRAAGAYAAAGLWDEAIHHALLAGEPDQAAEWVRHTAPDLLRRGDLSVLNKRLGSLPPAIVQQDLTLSLVTAWSQTLLPVSSSREMDLDALETWIMSAPDLSAEQRQSLRAEVQVMRVLASEDAEDAQRQGERTLALLPPTLEHLRPIVINQIAHIHRYAGRYGEAVAAYETVIRSPHTDELTRYVAYANLGRLYQMQNRLTEARAVLEQALHTRSTASTAATLLGFVHVALAWVELEQWHLDEALAQIELALPLCTLLNYTETRLYAEWTAAFIHLLRGDPAPALAVRQTVPKTFGTDATIATLWTLFALRFARLADDAAALQPALIPLVGEVRVQDIPFELEIERALTALALNDPDAAQAILHQLSETTAPDRGLLPVYRALIKTCLDALRGDPQAATEALVQALDWAIPQNHVLPFLTSGDHLTEFLSTQRTSLTPAQRAFVDRILAARAAESSPDQTGMIEPLSERELDVLRLLNTDLTGPEIARELIVSLATLRTHSRNIYSKLGVNNRRAAVRRAEELALL